MNIGGPSLDLNTHTQSPHAHTQISNTNTHTQNERKQERERGEWAAKVVGVLFFFVFCGTEQNVQNCIVSKMKMENETH